MSTWAKLAASDAPLAASEASLVIEEADRVAVVDANAIISGLHLSGMAQKFVTIPEVLAEIKDKQSRQFLSMLPYTLHTSEPTEDSIKTVQRFARETGDVHSLSTNDMKLLALAHTLEVKLHGTEHLREHPVQVKTRTKHRSGAKALPGWGSVPNPEDWKVVDEAPDNVLSNSTAKSRIMADVQELNLSDPVPSLTPAAPLFGQAAAGAEGTSGPSQPAQDQQQQPAVGPSDDYDDEDSEEDEDDGWAVAGKSRNAVRRKERRDRRKQKWIERTQAEAAEAAAHGAGGTSTSGQGAGGADGPGQGQASDAAAASASAAQGLEDGGDDHGEGSEEGESEDEGEEEEEEEESGSEGEEEETEEGASTAPPQSDAASSTLMLNTDSRVLSVTADFAMQNVIMQMNLRLVTRDGRQITKLSVWALRCAGCFFVTKEAGRLFCPKCGNMTLAKVEVMVGPGGAELYGVRKKHVLKGTVFSLPKPKSGRGAKNPILTEDVLMAKMKARRPRKAAADMDAFAPEYSAETWHQQKQAANFQAGGLLVTNARNNPNEVKPKRNSRRK